MFTLLLQNVLLWPASADDVQSKSPIADSQSAFIRHNYFRKKTKPNLNAGRDSARITACRT
jgi:hypothetical protein